MCVTRFPGVLTLAAVKIGFTMWRHKGERAAKGDSRNGQRRFDAEVGFVTEFIEQHPCDRGAQI